MILASWADNINRSSDQKSIKRSKFELQWFVRCEKERFTRDSQIVQDTVYFLCDKSVKSNFTFNLIFYIYDDSEKIDFHFFVVQNLKWPPDQNDP